MGSIDHYHICPGSYQGFSAAHPVRPCSGCGCDQQPALIIFRGLRIIFGLFHILYRDKANTDILIINHHQLFNTVFMQQAARFLRAGRFSHRNDRFCHQIGNFLIFIGGKAHITVGQNTDQLCLFIHNRHTADFICRHHGQRIAQ